MLNLLMQGTFGVRLAPAAAVSWVGIPESILLAALLVLSYVWITDRRRRRESDARLRQLAEHASTVLWLQDARSREVLYVSPGYDEVTGRSHQELYADWHAWHAVLHPEDRERVMEELAHIREAPCEREFRIVRPDGEVRWVVERGFPIYDAAGKLHRRAGALHDITTQKHAEQQRAQLNEVVEASPDFVCTCDRSGRVINLNHSARRLLGYPDETDLRAFSVFAFFPEWMGRLLREQAVRTAVRTGLWSGDGALLTHAGEEIPVFAVVLAHRDATGRIVRFSAKLRDLREWNRLHEQLRQSQKMEAVGRLAGGIAHDFNNVLFAIKTNASFLLADLPAGEPQHEDAQEIDRAVDRAATLTRQLLAFSRQQVLQPEVLELNAVVLRVDQLLRRLVGADIEFSIVLDPELRWILADPSQLEQVLLNLVVNARDAMPEGGRMVIETTNLRLTEPPSGWDGEVGPGDYVLLSVSDSGHGMDPATLAQIYEPFFTTKERGKGTGLGLSTVYGIVRQSGGHIRVSSRVGQGTTFQMLLPAVESQVIQPERVGAEASAPRRTGTVLVVDDEPTVRRAVLQILRRAGFEVLEASNGDEALRRVEQHTGALDLLLTDLVMPLMSGAELAEAVTRLRPGVRVLFMSGYTDERSIREQVREGNVAFLQKPFSPETLEHKLRELLDPGASA